jgi:hypothetical protein
MVGGKIASIWRQADRIRIIAQDRHDFCAIHIEPTDEPIVVGDDIWWQGRVALWTPADRSRIDVHLPRIGYSFTPRFLT